MGTARGLTWKDRFRSEFSRVLSFSCVSRFHLLLHVHRGRAVSGDLLPEPGLLVPEVPLLRHRDHLGLRPHRFPEILRSPGESYQAKRNESHSDKHEDKTVKGIAIPYSYAIPRGKFEDLCNILQRNLSFSYEPFFSRLDTAGVWKDDRRICMYVSQRALLTCLDLKSGKKIDIDWLDAKSAISKRIHSQCGGKAEIGKFFSILRYVAPSGTLMSWNPREMSDGLMIRPSIFYVVSQKLPRYYQKRKRTIQKDNYSRIRMLFPFF